MKICGVNINYETIYCASNGGEFADLILAINHLMALCSMKSVLAMILFGLVVTQVWVCFSCTHVEVFQHQ